MPYQSGATRGSGARADGLGGVAILVVALVSGMGASFLLEIVTLLRSRGSSAPAPAQQKQVYAMQGATELDINNLSAMSWSKSRAMEVRMSLWSLLRLRAESQLPGPSMVLTSDDDITVYVPLNVA